MLRRAQILIALLGCTLAMTTATAQLRIDAIIETPHGEIAIHLYEDTPQHRANFLKLVKEGFYDGLQFHRVIQQFMIQGGDPNSRDLNYRGPLGSGDVGYTLEAEIRPQYFHRAGALAAARTGDEVNPERRSSGCQFYLVQGKKYRPTELDTLEEQLMAQQFKDYVRTYLSRPENRWIGETIRQLQGPAMQHLQQADPDSFQRLNAKLQAAENDLRAAFAREATPTGFSEAQKQAYTTVGGTPFLDGAYTVFGEVVYGLEVIDKIAALATDGADRPTPAVVMRARLP